MFTEQGYRWPAEWEPHEATWLSWPRPDGISFPGNYDTVMPVFVEMVRHLARGEEVRINVGDAKFEKEVRAWFKGDVPAAVRFFPIPIEEPWCRDHGPIFLVGKNEHKTKILDWGYNAWGGKYPPFEKDDRVPTEVGKALRIFVEKLDMILEGGSIEGNGQGTLLTTESCLLNPNRNPKLSKEQIEKALTDHLGVTQILWLGDGIEGDDTDGHIDDLTRFVSRDTVITVVENDKSDPNHEPLRENYERLKRVKLLDGSPLKVIPIEMPGRVEKEDLRLPASYANFYIANGHVLLPVFNDPKDGKAVEILSALFPGRKIVPIDCRELVWGLGAFHCLTQQQPRAI